MVNRSERRRLLESYRPSMDSRGVLARAVAGLLVVVALSLVGLSYPDEPATTVAKTTPPAANGR